jgi:hypothetical protein
MTCRGATKTPRGRHTEIETLVHSRTSTQGSNALLSLTLSRANSSTNTLKAYAKPKDVINKLLGGLENFFRVWVASHELQQTQMTRGEALYRHRLNRSPPSV